MFRRALTYHLIFAIAVGPLLCCCASGKASAQTTGSRSSARTEITHSCCAHKQTPAQSNHREKQAPSKPGSPAEKCPCKDGAERPQTVQTESVQGDVATFLKLLALDACVPVDVPSAGVLLFLSEPNTSREFEFPRLTTAELLYAHHNLRC